MTISTEQFTERLDALESEWPAIPARTLALTRASVRRTNDVVSSAAGRLEEFVEPIVSTATTATRTVVGQARSAVDRSMAAARRGRNETVGQLGAQVGRTATTVKEATEDLLDDATKAVAPETIDPASLADLTKAELYDRAAALDIEGRSQMSKSELVAAIRRA